MTVEEFLEKLEDVRPAGTGWVGICPAHEDRQASLGVAEGDESILVTCHAGCQTIDVLNALDLTFADLFPERNTSVKNQEPEAVYSYQDESGQEVFQSLRFFGKRFRQRHLDPFNEKTDGEGWVWNLEDVRRIPYRLPEVIAAVAAGQTVYITEGEKDADRLIAEGKTATCNPMGAGKWRPEFNEFFHNAEVIIVADRDEPGRNHADYVRSQLEPVAKKVWVVQARAGKDVSDHLDAGHSLSELRVMRKLKRGIVTAAELAEHARERLEMTELDLPGYMLAPEIPLVFRPGRMYAVGAYTGDGKTCLALQGMRTLASAGRRVGYFCLPPDQRVLTTDLRWVQIGDVTVGDELVGFPEQLTPYSCSLETSTVTRADVIRRPTYRIVTNRGSVNASAEHLFVVSNEFKSNSFRREWKATQDIIPGDRICFFEQPWETEEIPAEERGYLAAAFDGEGCISNNGSLTFYQNENPMLDRVKELLQKNGVTFSETSRHGNGRNGHMLRVMTASAMRMLGITRPPRLMEKSDDLWLGKRAWNKHRTPAVVQSVEYLGVRDVVAVGTSTATFIAEGFLSHNSLEMPEIDLMNRLVAHQGIPLQFTEEPWRLKTEPLLAQAYDHAVTQIEGWQAEIIFDSSANAETIREKTADREYEVIFVDHLHRFAWGDRKHLDAQVKGLTNIALELNVLVVVLCQLRKTQRGKEFDTYPRPTLQDFRETSQIGDDASMALAVWRQRDQAGLAYTGATEVIVLKNRHTTGANDAAGRTFMPKFDPDKQMFIPSHLSPGGV